LIGNQLFHMQCRSVVDKDDFDVGISLVKTSTI
jgi:hypothetical protein